MNDITWTIDQILGMAPDHLQMKAAESAAFADKWIGIGRNDRYVWGEFSNNQKTPNQSIIALPHFGFYCNCPSRKRPCRHSIALAILLVQRRDLFSRREIPPWVEKTLRHASKNEIQPYPSPTTPAFKHALTSYQKRLNNVQRGMGEFELWLRDMVHQGLASLSNKNMLYWREMANRLIDAEAPETVKALRRLAVLPGSKPDWPDQLLRGISRLYLLTQGYARYDSLPPEAQSDLRYATGWFADPVNGWSETLHDSWIVLGRRHELSGHSNNLRVWLWGKELKRPALLSLTPRNNDLQSRSFVSGTTVTSTLNMYPSAWPVRAQLTVDNIPDLFNGPLHAYHSLAKADRAYGKALTLNPWLRHFPLMLRSIAVDYNNERWWLRDEEGYRLPLPEKFLHGWHLQTVSQSKDSMIFGEWDGRHFQPLTISLEDRWFDLHTVRGVK